MGRKKKKKKKPFILVGLEYLYDIKKTNDKRVYYLPYYVAPDGTTGTYSEFERDAMYRKEYHGLTVQTTS